MPVVRAERRTTGLEAMSKALGGVLESIQQIKMMRAEQAMQDAVLNAMRPQPSGVPAGTGVMGRDPFTGMTAGRPETQEERMGRVAGAISQTRQQSYRPTGFGPLDAILGAFNPNVPLFVRPTAIENLYTNAAVREAFRDPMEDEYRRARLAHTQALTEKARRPAKEEKTRSALEIMQDNTALSDQQLKFPEDSPNYELLQRQIDANDRKLENLHRAGKKGSDLVREFSAQYPEKIMSSGIPGYPMKYWDDIGPEETQKVLDSLQANKLPSDMYGSKSTVPNVSAPLQAGNGAPITATNKETGERLISYDGGRTWQMLP